ncbi:MAG: hypothetical protein JSU72_02160 [Deltaproteobacteria bacterium]|nr:MAG: hypothetical protein JSU72_02160 [Deltaproteobacteria bacterium]
MEGLERERLRETGNAGIAMATARGKKRGEVGPTAFPKLSILVSLTSQVRLI